MRNQKKFQIFKKFQISKEVSNIKKVSHIKKSFKYQKRFKYEKVSNIEKFRISQKVSNIKKVSNTSNYNIKNPQPYSFFNQNMGVLWGEYFCLTADAAFLNIMVISFFVKKRGGGGVIYTVNWGIKKSFKY